MNIEEDHLIDYDNAPCGFGANQMIFKKIHKDNEYQIKVSMNYFGIIYGIEFNDWEHQYFYYGKDKKSRDEVYDVWIKNNK
tara:strand:+ start:5220 stop:5462 length:243 start_codon:yes stop_codon:yes gene_type:complete